jgi:Cu(I)/Ag(I) efflux system membrane fusion protein
MKSSHYRYLSVAIFATFLITGCQHKSGEDSTSSPQLVQKDGQSCLVFSPIDMARLTSAVVKEVHLPGVLETTGQVTFDDRLVKTITSRVQGRIENVQVSLWDNVTAGQPILQLYSPDFMTAEEEYLQAKSTSSVHGSQTFADMSEWMVTAAKRKLELLGMQESDIAAISSPTTTIWMRAPISGTITQNQAVIGSAVNPGDVLYQVATLDRVWITADIYETDLSRIKVGQSLEAVTTAFPHEIFRGEVSRVSPTIDPNAHTAQIKCEMPNPGLRLKPQMLARVRIVTQPGAALVVSQEALVFDGDGYYAFVKIGKNTVVRRRVEISSWNEQGYARIVSGLEPEDEVMPQSLRLNALWHGTRGESY